MDKIMNENLRLQNEINSVYEQLRKTEEINKNLREKIY